jgi:hypothetical protein
MAKATKASHAKPGRSRLSITQRRLRAYSCSPRNLDFHVIAYATNAPKARQMCTQANTEWSIDQWIATRMREADGLSASEVIWEGPEDMPAQHKELACMLWSDSCEADQ